MSNKYEIWLIIILILAIVITHSLPVLINNNVIEQVNPWYEQIEDIDVEIIEKTNIKIEDKVGRKYNNVFKNPPFELGDIKDYNLKKTNIIRCGTICFANNAKDIDYTVFESKDFSMKINKHLDIPNDHLIYYVKAKPGHKINEGKMEFMHNFNNNLKEIKSIWYLFPELDLEFEDGWVFRNIDDDTYHIPENNSIIEFCKNDSYEMLELKSDKSKYFVIILNF